MELSRRDFLLAGAATGAALGGLVHCQAKIFC